MRFDLYIESEQDLIDAVQRLGFVPLFRNSIPGFSVEEHVSPRVWFSAENEGVWEWKGPVIRKSGCAYGKFFDKKAVFISREWFADFANYRRNGYDFDARFDDGLAPLRDKTLFDTLDENAPMLSRDLKRAGGFGKGGRTGFDTVITRLQAQCYVVIRDFVYETDRAGKPYGWGVAEYSTPEKEFGAAYIRRAYQRTPEESYDRLFSHLAALLPEADEKALHRILKRPGAD